MNTRLSILTAILLLFCLTLSPGLVSAKVSGKISGMVSDSETGEPLVGASVRVVGTSLGTMTDEDGEYFMINVPAGHYDLVATHVGFETLTKKDVRVLLDLTTPVDFTVAEVAVELSNEVVVYATAPPVQKDLTSSRVIFTEERLKSLPNIKSVQSILANYPGVVTDRNNALHVRGGRSGQVTYYYDGFSIQDPFTSSAGIRIMPSALEELSLTSGGFTSEYGDALSGVVNAVTREGNSRFQGKARIYQGATHEYDVYSGDWGKLSTVKNRSASFDLSGPIPGLSGEKYAFFTAGEYLRDDGYLPHNWQTDYTGIAKFTAQPISNLKLKTNLTYNKSDGAVYYHRDVNDVSYDFNLDGLPVWERDAYLAGIAGNYFLSERAIVLLSFNRFYTRTKSGPAHLLDTHWSDWPGYSEDVDGVYNGDIHISNYGNTIDGEDPAQVVGFTSGDDFDPTYGYKKSTYNAFAGTLVNQLSKTNQMKTGFEYRKYDVNWDFKQFYNDQPYGEQYTSSPTYASIFVEDKLEYDAFVVNVGLRLDYRDADIAYNYTPEDTLAHYRDAESSTRLSPRLGLSFPVSEKSVMHFNYGVYYQVPKYTYLYTNLKGETESGLPLFGNPDLEPEETISYEFGLDHMIGDNIRLDVTAYYKDINDLVTTREFGRSGFSPMTKYTNDDYGSVNGIDVSLEHLPINSNFSGSISYGYLVAKGSGSYAEEPYYTIIASATDSLYPVSDYSLDFDQRHTVTASLDYRVPGDWSANLFGLKIPGAWGMSLVGYYGSGLPYTKTDRDGRRLGERNEARLPAAYSVDMRFNKDFAFVGKDRLLTVFLEIENLLDRRNVLDVYTRTGSPDDDAELAGQGLELSTSDLGRYNKLFDHDPLNFSAPRTIRTGLEFSF